MNGGLTVMDLERMRADARRLDWLEKQLEEHCYCADFAIQSDEEDGVWFARIARFDCGELRGEPYDVTDFKAETVRAAIDAAMGAPEVDEESGDSDTRTVDDQIDGAAAVVDQDGQLLHDAQQLKAQKQPESRPHKIRLAAGEFDELFASGASFHVERMDDTAFWIGIDTAEGVHVHINTGVHRGVWYFNVQEDTEGGQSLTIQRPRRSKRICASGQGEAKQGLGLPAAYAAKPVHLAKLINSKGHVSPLCATSPIKLDLSRATWTLRKCAVTCPKCLKAIAAREGSGEGRSNAS